MRFFVRRCLPLIALWLAGCGSLSNPIGAAAKTEPERISHTGNATLDRLNQGYSLLYQAVSTMKLAHTVLLVKSESTRTERVVTDITDYAGTMTDRLAALPAAYPNLRIDLQPLPEIERRTQVAIVKDRLISFAPVVGRSGADFERSLLLTLVGALHQISSLCRVMAEQEPNPDRLRLLVGAEQRGKVLAAETERLLNRVYYKIDEPDPAAPTGPR